MHKTCSKCKTEKSLDSFYKNKKCRFGRTAYCKECRRKLTAENRSKKRNRELLPVAEGYKRCKNLFCRTPVQPTSEFVSTYARRKTFTAKCRHCRTLDQRSTQRPTTRAGRCKQVWTEWQKSRCCADCGETDYRLIQADHNHDKVKNCSSYMYWASHGGVAALKEELLKCTPRCAVCHFLKTKERRGLVSRKNSVQQKMNILNAIKIKFGCQKCNRSCTEAKAQAFHFDHVDAVKKTINPSEAVKVSWKRFNEKLKEIESCQVLCANCHHLKTHYERN